MRPNLDLLTQLHKRGRDGRNPDEGFVSEVLAAAMACDPGLARRTLGLWGIGIPDDEEISVRTEVEYPPVEGGVVKQQSFIDVEVRSVSTLVWVENKVGASLNKYRIEVDGEPSERDQVEKYGAVLNGLDAIWPTLECGGPTVPQRRFLVVLARDSIEGARPELRFLGSRRWVELYRSWEEYAAEHPCIGHPMRPANPGVDRTLRVRSTPAR